MNYQKMSDFEINKAVERLTGMYCEDCSGAYIPTCDYCNNPADAWPVIVDNGINIHTSMNQCFRQGGPSAKHSNLLRAAMIVFLMASEQKS